MAQPGLDRDPWCELITAFLELCIAVLLLATTTISLFTSKLIKFFDLRHPCSYLGLGHEASSLCDQHQRLVQLSYRSRDSCLECLRSSAALSLAGPSSSSSSEVRRRLSDGRPTDEQSEHQVDGSEKKNVVVPLYRAESTGDRCVKRKLEILHEEANAEDETVPEDKAQISSRMGVSEVHSSDREAEARAEGDSDKAVIKSLHSLRACSDVSVESIKAAFEVEKDKLNALYAELEEERNASAIAASEAMAMITRLQEEKAAIQMEARQYQRMVEEKADYDQEAITLLKEILYKREHEKFVLEKEVELYRKRLLDARRDDEEYSTGTEDAENGPSRSSDVLLLEGSPQTTQQQQQQYGNDGIRGCNLIDSFDLVRTDNGPPSLRQCSPSSYEGTYQDNEAGSFNFDDDRAVEDGAETPRIQNGLQVDAGGSGRRKLQLDLRTSSMVMRDNYRMSMEEDIRELTTRLQVLDEHRQLLRQIVQSLKAEKQDLREIAQHLRELRFGSDSRGRAGCCE